MRNLVATFTGLVLFLSLTIAPALSEDKKSKALSPKDQAQYSSQAKLAAGLAALGESEKDPDLLITAAKILEGMGKDTKVETAQKKTLTAEGLLDEAKKLGASPDTVAAVAKKRSTMSPRDWYCEWIEYCDYWGCSYVEDCYYY